jgi:hypothetical protein
MRAQTPQLGPAQWSFLRLHCESAPEFVSGLLRQSYPVEARQPSNGLWVALRKARLPN